jgi:hypothetical protein
VLGQDAMAGTVELHGKSITVAWSDAWLRSAGRARRPSPHDPLEFNSS